MPKQLEIISSADSSKNTNRSPVWLLSSNQRNLLYMFAAGLIMPPQGFGKKYYQDSLNIFPGWIPLFADKVPLSIIEQAVSEKKHLKPCLIAVNPAAVRGKVKAVMLDGTVNELSLPDELTGAEQVLMIPAPLPVTFIETVFFKSQKDRRDCEMDARDFDNVPLLNFSLSSRSRLFQGKDTVAWPPEGLELPDLDRPMSVSLAAGAMMAMLLRMGNMGDMATELCRLAFDAEISADTQVTDSMLSPIAEWLHIGHTPEYISDVTKRLFWGAIDRLIISTSAETQKDDLNVMLRYLQASAEELDNKLRQALLQLTDDLETIAGFGDSTVNELLQRHSKPFSRVMTLFFLRERCTELFELKNPQLMEEDYLAAAILFAARDGWLGLPLNIRDSPGLEKAVCHRMAVMAHGIARTKIDLGPPPERPRPLRELFMPGPRGWTKAQREAAVHLALDAGWSGIQTRIKLGKGEYRVEIKSNGLEIIVDGDAKSVFTEVDPDIFFSNLAGTLLNGKKEQNVRKLLKV